MFLNKLKQAGMKWASSPQAMKVMTNPNVQKLLMKALQMPSNVRKEVQTHTHSFAAYADLVTRQDMVQLKRALRDVERELSRVQRALKAEQAKAASTAAASAPSAAAPEASSKSSTATTGEAQKKKKVVKKKVVKKKSAASAAAADATAATTEAPKKKKKVVKKKVVKKKKAE